MNEAELIVCRRATLAEIYPLRVAVLRPGEERVPLHFAGDEKGPPETWHFGAFEGKGGAEKNVGCFTLLAMPFEGMEALQLRGMAVAAECRGTGVGSQMLQAAEREVRADGRVGNWRWWCNARKVALSFYERNGWQVVSEEFVIEKYGPHRRMVKEVA